MKVTVTIPDMKVASIAATAAMMQGQALPAGFQQAIETTPEVDITDELNADKESALVVQALALVALGKLIDKCESQLNNEDNPKTQEICKSEEE